MAEFRASAGTLTARFGRDEAGIIRDLVSQVAGLVGGAADPASPGPDTGPEATAGARADSAPGPVPGPTAGPDGVSGPAETAEELDALVEIGVNTELPDDPVLARLLPDGYSDDPEAAAEFRRFTESSLRSAKVAAAQAVLDSLPATGGQVRLSAEQAQDWLRALNDVRLALGVLLGVTDNLDDLARQIGPKDPRYGLLGLLEWLGYLQSSLITALP